MAHEERADGLLALASQPDVASISMGAVYTGALTYIGNVPNFMVYAVAEEQAIRMSNFFSYTLWAAVIIIPLFALLTLLPMSPFLKMG